MGLPFTNQEVSKNDLYISNKVKAVHLRTLAIRKQYHIDALEPRDAVVNVTVKEMRCMDADNPLAPSVFETWLDEEVRDYINGKDTRLFGVQVRCG